MPIPWYNVLNTRCTEYGFSLGYSARLLVQPTTCPIRMPPPMIRVDMTGAQWSRPALSGPWLIRGERPNSPQTTEGGSRDGYL